MRIADLTPVEIADLIDAAYLQDQGEREDGPDPETQAALADYLGCHEEARAGAWDTWMEMLQRRPGVNFDDREYWLDVEFLEPCE